MIPLHYIYIYIYTLNAVSISASKVNIDGFAKHNFTSCAQLPSILYPLLPIEVIANARQTRNINA